MQRTELYSANCGSVGDRRTARLAKTSHSGPVSTRDLPGQARYRREDAPSLQPPDER
jgi:hypothetical protein